MKKEYKRYQVWECKIVVDGNCDLPKDFDYVPRHAAVRSVEMAGSRVIDCFSGWGAELTKGEKSLVDLYHKQNNVHSRRDLMTKS